MLSRAKSDQSLFMRQKQRLDDMWMLLPHEGLRHDEARVEALLLANLRSFPKQENVV